MNNIKSLDIHSFDRKIQEYYSSESPNYGNISELDSITFLPDFWMFALKSMTSDCSDKTKFIVINLFQRYIPGHWFDHDDETRDMIKSASIEFLMNIYKKGVPSYLIECVVLLLSKIAIHDYPERWPTFLDDIIELLSLDIESKMLFFKILDTLSTMLFDTTNRLFTTTRSNILIQLIKAKIEVILSCIYSVLNDDTELSIVSQVLDTFIKISLLIDPAVIMESDFLSMICNKYLNHNDTAPHVINVLGSVIAHPNIPLSYVSVLPTLFDLIAQNLFEFDETELYPDTFMNNEYIYESILSVFTNFFSLYWHTVYNNNHYESMNKILKWCFFVTIKSSNSLFDTCLEFWQICLHKLFTINGNQTNHPDFIKEIGNDLAYLIIGRMPKPQRITKIIDNDGIERGILSFNYIFGSSFSMAKDCLEMMRATNIGDIPKQILDLYIQINTDEISKDSLISLCWASSVISFSESNSETNDYIIAIIGFLFDLLSKSESKDFQISIAESICMLISQIGFFLNQNPIIFKVLTEKIFEFMQSDSQTLQAYAIDSVKSISYVCKGFFKRDNNDSIVQNILKNIDQYHSMIHPDNYPIFYEMLSKLVQNIFDDSENGDKELLFGFLVHKYDDIVNSMTNPIELLNILKAFSSIPLYIRSLPIDLVMNTLINLSTLYINLSSYQDNEYSDKGLTDIGLIYLSIRAEILLFTERTFFLNGYEKLFSEVISPYLFNQFLDDFCESKSIVPQIFSLFSNLIWRFPSEFGDKIPLLINRILKPFHEKMEVQVMSSDFYTPFYRFINSLSQRSGFFNEIYDFAQEFFEILVFGCKLDSLDVSYSAYQSIIRFFLEAKSNASGSEFIEKNSLGAIMFLFKLLIDPNYRHSQDSQIHAIVSLFFHPGIRMYLEGLTEALIEEFPSILPEHIWQVVMNLNTLYSDSVKCKEILLDFVVQSNQVSLYDHQKFIDEKRRIIAESHRIIKEMNESMGLISNDESLSISKLKEGMMNATIKK